MTAWDADTLARIARTDDLHVAPFRDDGVTTGTPTWIWSVVTDDRLFVRPWNAARSRWYRAAMAQHGGQITAADTTHDVTFTAAPDDDALNARIDAAYRAKYGDSSYLPPMLAAGPRSCTVEITPAG